MDFEGIMLSEISQTKTNSMISLIFRIGKFMETENRLVVARS